jgi:hypothetical protein
VYIRSPATIYVLSATAQARAPEMHHRLLPLRAWASGSTCSEQTHDRSCNSSWFYSMYMYMYQVAQHASQTTPLLCKALRRRV